MNNFEKAQLLTRCETAHPLPPLVIGVSATKLS